MRSFVSNDEKLNLPKNESAPADGKEQRLAKQALAALNQLKGLYLEEAVGAEEMEEPTEEEAPPEEEPEEEQPEAEAEPAE